MNKYSIGEVSKITGLSTKTLRFYEEKGVISSAEREENGYRYFDEEDLKEIKLIKNARDLGLPLAEIKKLAVGCEEENCKHPEAFIKNTINNYTSLLTERINQMTELRSRLRNLEKNGPYCCGILHQLSINDQKGGECKC